MLSALKDIIAEDIHRGNRHLTAPDPAIVSQSRSIFQHTFLRRETASSDEDFILWLESSPTQRAEVVNMFLSKWNGRWELDIIEHFCDGTCGPTPWHCIECLYASAVAIDLLMSSDSDCPQLDDWLSFGRVAGTTSAGIVVHNIFWRCQERALPHHGMRCRMTIVPEMLQLPFASKSRRKHGGAGAF